MNSFFWTLAAAAFILSSVTFAGFWFFGRKINNYSIVDIVWSYSFLFIVCFFVAFSDGWILRKILLLGMVGAWSLRLGTFLFWRIYKSHPAEDNRYQNLRKKYAPKVATNFFWFFQFQAWSVVLLCFMFLEISLNPLPEVSTLEKFGFCIWLLAFVGEALADHQMTSFRTDPKNKGQTCKVGLWRYSRHPNYFFESLIWWGFFIFALGTAGTFYTIYSPLIILLLLLKVTGIPPAEAQSLKSRGEAYRQYQRETSAFIPWFPKI